MKKLICLLLICVFVLAGCAGCAETGKGGGTVGNNGMAAPKQPEVISSLIGDDATVVRIDHTIGGQSTTWYAVQQDIISLKNWLSGLKCTPCTSCNDGALESVTGNEVYTFEYGDRSFEYIDYGGNDCYLLIDSSWYSVDNPSDPPEQSFFSDPTLDESITIENSDGKLLFRIISTIPEVEYKHGNGQRVSVDNADDGFFSAVFRLLDRKPAIDDYTNCAMDHRIFVSKEGASYRYEFALHSECGSVTVTNNGKLIGTVTLSSGEVDTLLCALNERLEVSPDITHDTRTPVPFRAQYIRTDGYHEGTEYPIITLIKSKTGLDAYYNRYAGLYDFSHKDTVYADTTIGFIDATGKYDDTYFDSNVLVAVLVEEGSGSIRHNIRNVYSNGDFELERLVPDGDRTDDMAAWSILIEIGKSVAADCYRRTPTAE